MATLKQQIRAEQSGRAMLEEAGLPQPDAVEYGYTCIRFFWKREKVFLVIEIDKPPEGFEVVLVSFLAGGFGQFSLTAEALADAVEAEDQGAAAEQLPQQAV